MSSMSQAMKAEPQKTGAVVRALDELRQNIGCLEEQVQRVVNALHPVLSLDTPKDMPTLQPAQIEVPKPAKTEVPMAQEIYACAYRVYELRVLLDDLQGRIEL
jgi:hypothetical protein